MQHNIQITQAIAHQSELRDRAERFRSGAQAVKAARTDSRAAATRRYEIRPLRSDEGEALLRVAQRDDRRLPAGPVLAAFSQGRLLAAISLSDGAYTADPFQASGEALELLRVRAHQLGTRPRRGLRLLFPSRARQAHAQASLAGSPPGAGGRLLQL